MKETFYDVHLPGNIKIALVADIHNQKNPKVIDSLRRQKPDLILIPGDIKKGYQYEREDSLILSETNSLEILKACPEIADTYFSLGNHEALIPDSDLKQIRSYGITVLDDSYIRKGDLILGGLTSNRVIAHRYYDAHYKEDAAYSYSHFLKIRQSCYDDAHRSYAFLDKMEQEEGYKILLNHHPEYFALCEPFLKERKIDLIVSGHAHGGQIRFYSFRKKAWQGILSPNQGLLPQYTSGVHEGPYGRMVITKGLANTVRPIPRLFNETEIVYIC